jgi:hypothetical protein
MESQRLRRPAIMLDFVLCAGHAYGEVMEVLDALSSHSLSIH